VREHGERLHRLAEPHLVAENRPLLVNCVLGSEHLIAAQRGRQEARVEWDGSDLLVQLLGDEPAGGLSLVGPAACAHGREDGIHRRCVGSVAVPELVGRVATRIDGALALRHCLLQRLCRRFGEECVEPGQRVQRRVLGRPAGEEHPQPAAGAFGLLCQWHRARREVLQRLAQRRGGAIRGADRGEGGE
jgi:hypothetical protein